MKKKTESSYFPILIDLSKFEIVVVGAGKVGKRKIENLLDFNAKLTIISPEIAKNLQNLDYGNIKIKKRKYRYGDIPLNSIVFCSTGDIKVNKLIQKECEEKHSLLNVADVPELCNFIMPAIIKRGDLTVSIASQGQAPFYVSKLKKQISKILSPNSEIIVQMAAQLRNSMIETGIYDNADERNKIFNKFFKLDFDKIISTKGEEGALNVVLQLIER